MNGVLFVTDPFRAVHITGAGHSVRRDNRPQCLAELTKFLAQHR